MAAFLLVVAGGCVQPLAQRGAEGGVKGLYEGVAEVDPALRAQVHGLLLGDAALRDAAFDVAQSVVRGGLAALADPGLMAGAGPALRDAGTALRTWGIGFVRDLLDRVDESVAAALDRLDRTIARATSRIGVTLARELPPALSTAVDALATALRGDAGEDLVRAAERVAGAATAGALDALSARVGDLAPAGGMTLDDVAAAAGLVTRTVAREGVAGLREGLGAVGPDAASVDRRVQEVARALGRGLGEGLGDEIAESLGGGGIDSLLWFILVAAGAAIVVLTVGLIVLWRRVARAAEGVRSAAGQVRETSAERQDQLRGLVAGLREAAGRRGDLGWLDEYLRARGF
jgi:hypothetical protein